MFGLKRKAVPISAIGECLADTVIEVLLNPDSRDIALRNETSNSGIDATRLTFELAAFDLFTVTVAIERARRAKFLKTVEAKGIAEVFSRRFYEKLQADLPLEIRMNLNRLPQNLFDPFSSLDWLDCADPELASLYAALNKRADGYAPAAGDLRRILQTFLQFCEGTSHTRSLGQLAALHFDLYGTSYLEKVKTLALA